MTSGTLKVLSAGAVKRGVAKIAADFERGSGNKVEVEFANLDFLLRDEVNDVLKTLTAREAKVIRLRFGLTDDGAQRTLEEVGAFFNVTRERIRQIEAKALRKLRHPSRSKKLRPFLDATF